MGFGVVAGAPGGPPRPPGGEDPRHEGEVATRTQRKVARPPRFKVVLYNDDYTPMAFVVSILETIFRKSPAESNALMLKIHRSGQGVGGTYSLDVAETKVAAVHRAAEQQGYPLRSGVEPE